MSSTIQDFLSTQSKKSGFALDSREFADFLSENDSLKALRNEFHYPKMKTLPQVDLSLVNPEEECIYMCGNSLGLMPKATKEIMDRQFEKWAGMGVFGHTEGELPWAHCDECTLDGIAPLVGAEPSEVAMMNGLTVNLHILLTSFYKPTEKRHKILLESRAFPSDHYAIESQIRLKGFDPATSMLCLDPREGEDCLRTEDILDVLEREGDSIAVVAFSGIQYYTGQLFDMPTITAAAHRKGCLVGWDLAHAFANVPIHLDQWDVDFACWCTYKYGSSGAGGMAGLYVNKRFAKDERVRMLGWWSHKMSTRFLMSNQLELDEGAAGFRISNPPMMLAVGLMGFLEVYKKTSIEQLRAKSINLTGYFEHLVRHHLGADSPHRKKSSKVSCSIMTPSDPAQRGCQLSLKFNIDIAKVYQELVKRGVACDKRYPNVIRATPVHFYNNYTDVWRFVQTLVDVVLHLEEEHAFNGSLN
ncbi:hypothetical protein QR680_017816 [Steinernema hermaphroditum]|uniref:Kynureninase n=1 Tax=Steinernema hermaphroditum TaxID=289476 RepID=A0AA39LPQ5_9BILA|nr:hypothetical protein QR680_017816 [Steinernema hermaphroditum]